MDHYEESELTTFFDSTGNSVIQETTRTSTHVNVECKGEVDIAVDRKGRVRNVNIKDK